MRLYHVTVNGRELSIGLDAGGRVMVNGDPLVIDVRQTSEHNFSVIMAGESLNVLAEKKEELYNVTTAGVVHEVQVISDRDRILSTYARPRGSTVSRLEVHAPMPALVVKVEVAVGDRVTRGSGLLVLEAMKMENEVKAHQSGRVKEIYVGAGKPVEKGELLMLLEENPENEIERISGLT